jgi:hypothetical protein
MVPFDGLMVVSVPALTTVAREPELETAVESTRVANPLNKTCLSDACTVPLLL